MSSPDARKTESKLAAQAARTRARLIETTLELLSQHQFQRMSLDAIAARAGVTKGAIYGHFESKDDLLMAAFYSRPDGRLDVTMAWPKREGTVRERLRRLGEAVVAQHGQSGPGGAAIAAEFMLYALTHEGMKPHVSEVLTKTHGGLEANIRALFAPEELPMPVESFALMLGALIPGLMFSRAFKGDRREAILAMFEGLAGPAR